MATEVAQLIFRADTSQLKSAETQIDNLSGKTQKAETTTKGFATATSRSGKASAEFGRKAGMAGIQFEQLTGQIAGGQNVMRAIGAQASDLGFILGTPLLGAVVGIGAAFLSMIPSMASASDNSVSLSDEVANLTRDLNELTEAQRANVALTFGQNIADLEKQNRGLTRQISLQSEEVGLLNEKLAAGVTSVGATSYSMEEFEAIVKKNVKELAELKSSFDGNNQEIDTLNGILNGTIGTTQDYVDALREEMITLGMSARQKAIYTALSTGANDAQIQEINLLYDGIDAKNADIEATKRANAEKIKATQLEESRAALNARNAKSAEQRFQRESQAASDNAANLALLQLEEDDRETQRFENQIIKLQEQKDKQLLTEQEYSDALAGIVAERARNLTAIELTEEQRRQDALAEVKKKDEETRQELLQKEVNQRALQTDLLISLEDKLLKGKSEKSKAAYRLGLNLANAERRENAKKIISSSYAAAMDAYKSLAGIPIIGPVLGAAAAGGILAAGVAYSAKSLAGRALGGQVRPGESYIVGERGPEVLTMGNTVGKITTNEALRGDNNTNNNTSNVANVSFTINANDTRGFDRLLQQRRGQIVNMINDALNENGKVAII